MKTKSRHRKSNIFLSGALAFTLAFTPALSNLPLMQVHAAEMTAEKEVSISSATLKVVASKTFPQVVRYETLTGTKKTMRGQSTELTEFKINGVLIKPTIGSISVNQDHIIYPIQLKNTQASVNLDMKVKISVQGNNVTWEVTELKKGSGCGKIRTIEVPKLNLLTISKDQKDTQFKGAVISANLRESGDREITFSGNGGFKANGNTENYCYAFVSGDGLSGGIWSNSEQAKDQRVCRNNGQDTISLSSSPWYYDYGDVDAAKNYTEIPVSDLPCAKVCITEDRNEDKKADWQDGAIALREIMNQPFGSEKVPEMVNYRIVMNFSGQAPNPFLKTADSIKRVYLATDGLGQAVMLKGYGSEGHDSANSEYAYIGERIGGVEDLKKLNTIAHEYNTQMGIHINAEEAYPEAPSFTDAMISGPNATGWNWLDQSYKINRMYDLGTRLRYKRMLQLYDRLNDTSLYANKWPGLAGQGSAEQEKIASAEEIKKVSDANLGKGSNLDFIYLDVWFGDTWETRKVSKEMISLGWRWSTEFGYSGEYDSTWQHMSVEGGTGVFSNRGLNSDVIRFIRNHQKDSFVLNWPDYGGTADKPLLGGYDLTGYEGWQHNNNFDDYITRTFSCNLPTKFLQHYQVVRWENYEGSEKSPVANHEKQITLKNDKNDTVVVTRKPEKKRNDTFIERTITLNNKKVLDDVAYLLPWTEEKTKEEKLYHYNYDGGTTTWELPAGWDTLQNLYIYKLTDQGRTDEQKVNITGGKITLKAEAKVAYVLVKGTEGKKTIANYGEGSHLQDPGFNGYAGTGDGTPLNNKVWTGDTADAKVLHVQSGNKYLVFGQEAKDVAISTTITDLIPGEHYVAQVYVDNRSDEKAVLEVTGGEKTVSNYTLKSLAENFVRSDVHNKNAVKGSKMQLMLVSFQAKTDQAVLSLKREAGKGLTYMDDLRIVHKTLNNIQEDGSFQQDFESVTAGLYPFVMGPAQGVEDQVTHLSERHDPYTQSGWGNIVLDDVIGGKWSLKHHGNNKGILYRTIPQNLHLEPGITYQISFDYQAGCANAYRVVVGEGTQVVDTLKYMDKTAAQAVGKKSTTKRFAFELKAGESGQSWFGIESTGSTGENKNFGQRDFILDNLEVKRAVMSLSKSDLEMHGIGSVEYLKVVFADNEQRQIKWTSSNPEVGVIDASGRLSAKAQGHTVITAEADINGKRTSLTCNVTVYEQQQVIQEQQFERVVYVNTEETAGEKSPGSNAIDGDYNTFWHSQYKEKKFAVSESNPAILTLKLAEDANAFNGLQFVQRPSQNNGLVSKIAYVFGNRYDETTHQVGDIVKEGTAAFENPTAGTSELIDLGKEITAKYLQIKVLAGEGSFAVITELNTSTLVVYPNVSKENQILAEAEDSLKKASEKAEAAQTAYDAAEMTVNGAKTEREKAQAEVTLAEAELALKQTQLEQTAAERAVAAAEKAMAEIQEAAERNVTQKANLQRKIKEADKWINRMMEEEKTLREITIPQARKKISEKKAELERVSKINDNNNATPNPGIPTEKVTTVVKNVNYKILDKAKGTAVVLGGKTKTLKSVNIQATVQIGGKNYKVTQIADNAFKNNKKLTKVVIGKNVTTIGKNSFQNCKKLSKVLLKGTAIKTVKSGAFKKTSAKITISVPKKLNVKKRSTLKKALRKGGISNKVKIK